MLITGLGLNAVSTHFGWAVIDASPVTAFVCLFLIICFHFLFALQFLHFPYQFLCLFCIMHILLFFLQPHLIDILTLTILVMLTRGPRKTGTIRLNKGCCGQNMPLNIPPYGALCNFVVDNKKKPALESFLFHGYGWPST